MRLVGVKEGMFGKMDNADTINFIKEFIRLEEALLTLTPYICLEDDYTGKLEEDEDFSDLQLDQIDIFTSEGFDRNSKLYRFIKSGALPSGRVYERYINGFNQLSVVIELCRKYADLFVPLEKDEIIQLQGYLRHAIANLTYAFNLQFDVVEIYSNYKNEKSEDEIEIQLPLYNFIVSRGESVKDFTARMFKVSKEYPPQMGIFERMSEFTDDFFSAVPEEYYYLILENESKVTVSLIKDVISGKVEIDADFMEDFLSDDRRDE